MNMATQKANRISVRDQVRFTLGTASVQGVVVDDRGPIGAGKVHIFRIRVSNDPYDDDVFEMPEDEIEVIDQDTSKTDTITASEAKEYLERGGLIRILRAGSSGGKTHSHAWLRRDSLGNVTHTFSPDRGDVGGAIIPLLALRTHRVLTPKRDEVLNFLTAFGLPLGDAEHVLEAVGTTP